MQHFYFQTSAANNDHVYAPFESVIVPKKKTFEPTFESPNSPSPRSSDSDIPVLRAAPHPPESPENDNPSSNIRGSFMNNNTQPTVTEDDTVLYNEGSDEDTSADADFVRASFWLRNRKTICLGESQTNMSSMFNDLSVTKPESYNGDDRPVPLPRKKKISRRVNSDSASQVLQNYPLIDIPPAIPDRHVAMEPVTKIVAIEDLDDGYQTIIDFQAKALQKTGKSDSSGKVEVCEPNKYGIAKMFVDLPEPEKGDKLESVGNGDLCSSAFRAKGESCSNSVSNSTHSSPMHRNQNTSMSKSKSENLYAPFPMSDTELKSKHSDSTSQPEMQIYEPVKPIAPVVRTNSMTGLSGEFESRGASAAYVPEEYSCAPGTSVTCASYSSNQSTNRTESIYEDISFRNPPPVPARPMSSFADPPIVPVRFKSVNRRSSGEFVRRIPSPVPTASKTDEDLKKGTCICHRS